MARSAASGEPLYQTFAQMLGAEPECFPRLTINLFSGGKHAGGQVAIQDVLMVPLETRTIDETLSVAHEIYETAASLILERFGMRRLRADEGGLAPPAHSSREMIELAVEAAREGFSLSGFAGVPTFHRPTAATQLFMVNNRPVKDRLLSGALRAAYADLLPRDRHPVVALMLTVDPREVDVNVHPAKAEVRFRDAGHIRALLISALKEAVSGGGLRVSSAGADFAVSAFQTPPAARYSATPSHPACRQTRRRISAACSPIPAVNTMASSPPSAAAKEPNSRPMR